MPIHFGSFELDLRTGELSQDGHTVRLATQPLEVLVLLLEHSGELVTREQLRQKLWSDDTFVDFEHGLNAAVKRLREALGDTVDNPRFIETLPRHGYRFIGPVAGVKTGTTKRRRIRPWLLWSGVVLLVAAAAAVIHLRDLKSHSSSPNSRKGIRSLAILPLENLSNDPDQEYFSEGMAEALISELGRIRALRVISRQSAMHYKGTTKTVPEIARELNVDALVEGAVLRDGGKVRISTQLIQAEPEEHLWAATYEREQKDVIALQTQVARDIASHVMVSLTPQEVTQLTAGRHPRNPESYDAYLRARYFHSKWTEDGMRKALEYAKRAVELDPTDAAAQAELAGEYLSSESWGLMPRSQALPARRAATFRALELDNTLPLGHTLMGWLRMGEWDWAGAEKEYRYAIELDPGNVDAHNGYSWYLSIVERHDEAVAEIRKCIELEPLSIRTQMGLGYRLRFAHRYEEALAHFQKLLEMEPSNLEIQDDIGTTYLDMGRYQEAMAALEKLPREGNNFDPFLIPAYAKAGRRQDAIRLFKQRLKGPVGPVFMVWCHGYLGNIDEAFRWLEKMYDTHDDQLLYIKVSFIFKPLRSDPRYQDMLRRMNFPSMPVH